MNRRAGNRPRRRLTAMTIDALYKISVQLQMRKIECEYSYKDDSIILGEDHPNTRHWKESLAEAEEAIKLFDELRQKMLEGGEADAK